MDDKQILEHVINGVEIEILNYKCDYVGIKTAKSNGYYYLNEKLHITYNGGSTGKSLNECKLIIKPLSDLSKHDLDFMYFQYIIYTENNMYVNRMEFDDFFNETDIYHLPICLHNYLLKHHFDVFGLTEKGLAIRKTD